MGDHRAHIDIKFEMYGKKRDWTASINWFADPGDIDARITEWLVQAHDEMYSEHMEATWRREREEEVRRQEEAEKREYERLKAKFEATQ
jgi:hypothetical protein